MAATLHLLRHAKSSWDEPELADRDRPLSARGRRAGGLMATHLRERGIQPDLILCSPSVRTRQTLELVAEGFGGPPPLPEFEDELYGAGAEELLARLRRLPAETSSALMIGHNPGCRDLALMLGADEATVGKFPTGALATFVVSDWSEIGPESGRLIEFVKPKQLA